MVRRLPHAVLRGSGPATPSTTSGPTVGATTRTRSRRLDRRRRQAVLHPDLQLPVGRHLPQELVRGEGLHRSRRRGRVHDAGRQDEGGRPHPARVRGQGRLARDGHVRHPQHAHERLRVPYRPDGRQGEVDGPEGQGRVREVGRAAALHSDGAARADLAGSAPRTWSNKKAGMYFLGTFAPAGGRRGRPRRPRLLPVPDVGTEFDAEMGIDAPIDGFMLSAKASEEPRRRQGVHGVPRHGRGAGDLVLAGPNNVAAAKDADTSGYTASRRRRPRSSAASSRSPSSSTATRVPDFAGAERHAGLPARLHREPDQDLDAFLARIQGFWDTLSPARDPAELDSSGPWLTERADRDPAPPDPAVAGRVCPVSAVARPPATRPAAAPLQPADRRDKLVLGADGRDPLRSSSSS